MSYEDFLNRYSPKTETDTLSPFDQFLIDQKIREQKEKEDRLRLEEENRIKEAERKANEENAARLEVENLSFEEVKDSIIQFESKGDAEAEFVNKNGTKDIGIFQINERWVNQNPTENNINPYALLEDGNPDPVYNEIHKTMSEKFPQWDTIDDKGRKMFLKIPEINEQVARIIYKNRGLDQWSTASQVKDSLQAKLRNNTVDDMVNNSISGNNPTLDDISKRINLDMNYPVAESSATVIDARSPDEVWQDKIAEAQREKTFFDAVSKYANDPVRLIPFLNTSSDIKEVVDITNIMDRINKANQDGIEPSREDMLKLYEYQQANQSKKSFGYKVGTILGELPAFAGEIGLTGGIYSAGKKATLSAGKLMIKKALGKEARDMTAKYIAKHKILDGTLKFGSKAAAAISGATMQTTFNEGIKEVGAWATDDFLPGGRIRLGMKEHMMGTLPITMEESGELEAAVFTEGDDFNEAFAKSATDLWIEMVSERSGGAFPKLGSVARKWAVKQGILKKFLELNPTKKSKDFNKILNRVGWNGMLGEMAEERIGEIGRGIAYEVGIEDEGFKYKLPTMEQLAVEVVAFSIPGAGIALTQGALGKTGENKDPIPEFDLNDPVEVKKAIKAQGLTVEVVENDGAWDVNAYTGKTILDQSTGHADKKNADAIAESMEKDLSHFANAKEVKFEGERPPIMEEEGITVEAKPVDQLELELKDKQDYNKMLVKDLKTELKNRNLSRAGKKADLVARLQEADKEATIEEEVPAEDVGLTEEEKADAKKLIDEYVPKEEQEVAPEIVPAEEALTLKDKPFKKTKDFDTEGTYSGVVGGREFKIFKDAAPGSLGAWFDDASGKMLGFTKKEAIQTLKDNPPKPGDKYDMLGTSLETKATEKEAPADTRTQEEIEAENLALMEEMGLTDTDKKTGEAIPPQGLSQVEKDEIDDADDISDIDTKEQQALERLEKSIGVKKFFDNTDSNYKLADKITDAAIVGAGIIRRGAKSFKQFSSEMVKKIGKGVKPYLKKLYNNAKAYVAEYIKNPKIGLGIEIVGGMAAKVSKMPETTIKKITNLLLEERAVGMATPERSGEIRTLLSGVEEAGGPILDSDTFDADEIALNNELKALFPNQEARNKAIDFIDKSFITDKDKQDADAYSLGEIREVIEDMTRRQREVDLMSKMSPKELSDYKADQKRAKMKARKAKPKKERPLAPKPIDFKKASITKKSDIVYTYIFNKGMNKAQFIQDYMSVAQSKESRKGLSRGEYKINLSKMYDSGKKSYKKGIKTLVKEARDTKGLKETFDSGKHLMEWYDGFFPYMQKKFGKDAPLVADFIAITSAGVELKPNITHGLKAYAQYKLGEEFYAGRRPNRMRGALKRAVKNHEQGTNLSIGGDKITNFSAALKGDVNAVTLDMWMAREFGIKQTPAQKKSGDAADFNDAQYRRYEQIIKDLAFEWGVTPRQAQAGIWFGIREGHSPMWEGDPGLESLTYEQIIERTMPNFTYTDKNGKEHSLTDLNKDTIVYLNGSFGLTPEMLDTIGKALVDTGRYVYDNLSPAMQKMGNRLGVNAQNFKLRFAQFKNDAKGMTDAAKKWFKKVVGHMKAWFKRNGQKLIDSKPVQRAHDRLENMVTFKAVPEGIDALAEIRRSIEDAEAKIKVKGGKQRKPSETPFYQKVRAGRIQPKIDRQDNIASPWGQMFYLLSGRLKKVTGGMGILRALRSYEKHALTIEDDLKKAEPWLKFLHKLQPSKLKPWKNKEDWKQLEIALLKGNMDAILEIVDKYNAREAYNGMREMLDNIYYRAVNLTQEEKAEYDKLILDLAKARKEVPNKSWNVDSIKVWLTEKDIKYTSKDKKDDLLNKVSEIRGMKKKMSTLEKNEARFSKLDKKIIYNFPYWGDDVSVYFPRDVVDPAAFNGYLTDKIGTGEMNKIEESLRDRHGIKKGEELPPGMLAQAIDAYLRTGGATVRGGKPGSIKGRIIEKKTDEGITDDMVPYYSDPITSLMGYIHRMNESIARQKLFGKGVDIDSPNNSENVGAFVEGLITGENELGVKIDRKDQEEIKDIFQARFANSWGRFAGLVQTVKNATYMASLVDIFTTFIQTGDLFTGAIYRAGRNPIILTKAITKAFLGQIPGVNKLVRSPIDARDYGLIRISAEYTNKGELLGKALNSLFKLSGFAAVDRIGKESLVNATIMRAQKEAKKGKLSPKTQNLIDDAFGKDSKKAKEVIKQLETGEINDDIISLAYWTLLEHQPVAESEMPALYLRSSGAKLFYQLKTWQMKQLSLWRSETVGMWKKGQKAQAIKNGITMTIALTMAGAAPDVLRDFFQGRPIHLKDFVVENLFRLFGISKYSAERGATGDFEFFLGGSIPASRLVSSVGKDMAYLNKWLKWAKDPIFESPPKETPKYGLSSTNLIPLVGKQLYTGLPFPRIPKSIKEIKEMIEGVPDSKNGYIIEGWRGRKQILKRQVIYYNELTDEKLKKGEFLTPLEMHLQMQATIELANLEFQESLDNFWWQDKIRKIAKATGLQAP